MFLKQLVVYRVTANMFVHSLIRSLILSIIKAGKCPQDGSLPRDQGGGLQIQVSCRLFATSVNKEHLPF